MIRSQVLSILILVSACFNAFAAKEIKYKPIVSSYEKLPAAKKGGVLYTDLSGNPKVINVLLSNDSNSTTLNGYLWSPLMGEDNDTLEPVPALAESYTISADKKSYTYVLQANAKWEDGTPVTSDDAKFTFDIMMNPKTDTAPLRAYYEGVQMQVKDGRTFTFTVPSPKFDTLRTLNAFYLINKKQFVNEPDFNKARGIVQPVGNGPYKLVLFQRDQRVELERNKNWWGNSIPNLKNRYNFDKIVFRLITDPGLLYERFLKGDLDVVDFRGPSIETFQQKVRGIDKAKVGTSPKDGKDVWAGEFKNKAARPYYYVGWNLHKPMFATPKTRRALAHLTDVQNIVDKVFYGYYLQTTSPWGSLSLNSDPELRKPGKMITYDLKKALQLLKEDGWADSNGDNILDKMVDGKRVDFSFTMKYNSNNPARGRIAQILKENFKKAGIDITIRSMEWNAFLDDVQKHDFDAIVMGWTTSSFPNAKQIWHSSSEANQGSNYVGYHNAKVDALIDKSNLEMDYKKRAKMMQEINRLIYEDQPYLFLVEPRSLIAGFNKKIKSAVWAMQFDVTPPTEIYTAE